MAADILMAAEVVMVAEFLVAVLSVTETYVVAVVSVFGARKIHVLNLQKQFIFLFTWKMHRRCIFRAPNTLSTAITYVSVTLRTATRNSATITTSAAVKMSAAITTYART
ncbi:hypothetical protein J6590_073954 [Homalodisca vitripennis]|nr:hypothetical protein J6590_073954 [Homalodisca vitripennis]